MRRNKVGMILGGLILASVLFFAQSLPILVLLDQGPLWMYFVITGIILSGYLAISHTLQDREIDRQFIEKEGQVYLEKIKKERDHK